LAFDWVSFLPVGFEMPRHALLLLGDYIYTNPSGIIFYADDDRIDGKGERFYPRLKPSFDIDYLRCHDYLGPSIVISRDALHALNGLEPLGSSSVYEFILRAWEAVGDTGFVRVPHVLFHLRWENDEQTIDWQVRRACLKAHLDRVGADAEVTAGPSNGIQHVDWSVAGCPSVCIIIATRDKPEYLIACVESILEKTNYPNFSVTIANNDSKDPDVITWLANVGNRYCGRVTVLEVPGKFNFSKIVNAAVQHAKSDFVCLMDNDTEVVHQGWLRRMVALAQRPDVGVVGPRLVSPETGVIQHAGFILGLGVTGVASSPHVSTFGMTDPGPMGRLHVTRACAAVSSSCMLVERNTFLSAGGLDESAFGVFFAAIDFCLRIRRAGLRILWTPAATVVHFGQITIARDAVLPSERTDWSTALLKEREEIYTRWMKEICDDPFYHPRLSLRENNFEVDRNFSVCWDTNFNDRPRVLGIPLPGGAGNYRVIDPFNALSDSGVIQTQYLKISKGVVSLPTPVEISRISPDSVIFHSGLDDACLGMLEQGRRFSSSTLWAYALDDLISQVPPKSSVKKTFTASFRDAMPRLRAALALCDRVIVSTEPLADLCRPMVPETVVVPNRLSDRWRNLKSLRNTSIKPRIGWVGALQHQGDLELIEPVIQALHEEVYFVFMGMATDGIRPLLAEFHQPVDWDVYPEKLSSLNLDIALAPLEILPFNEAKSNLRLLEYGAVGWPVVCTDVFPYQQDDAPVTRVPNDPDAWIEAIRTLVADPDRRAREGDALREWVRSRYMLTDHLDEWVRALLR
jgi:GT2 family glycosyltransferase